MSDDLRVAGASNSGSRAGSRSGSRAPSRAGSRAPSPDRPPDPPPPEEDKTKKKKKRKDTVGDIVAADLEALASGAVGSDAKPELQNAVQLSKRTSKIDMDKVIDFQVL